MVIASRKLKKLLLGIVLLFFGFAVNPKERSSQTFFMPRSTANNLMLELALQNYRLYHNNYDEGKKPYKHPQEKSLLSFYNTYFYQDSTNGSALARYFLPGDKPSIMVDQKGGEGTIASKWLGLGRTDGTFKSNLSIKPNRKIYGTVFNYHHDFSVLLKGAWLSVMLPVARAEHRLNVKESLISQRADDPELYNASVALNQEGFHYGKLKGGRVAEVGFDDMQAKIGYNFLREEDARFGIYADFLIPLTGKPSAEFMFGHVLGNGGHGGLGLGVNFEADLYKYDKHLVTLVGDVRYRYMLPGTEKRSFDLKNNGEWSRNMLVVKEGAATRPLPGINFFTKDFKVEPRDRVEILSAVHYKYSSLNFEMGYNFWWKNTDKVNLKEAWKEEIGIFNPFAVSPDQGTASSAKIHQSFDSVTSDADDKFVKITQNDLNFSSAAHKAAVSHTFYGGFALDTQFFDSPWMVGLGGAYEVARDNSAMSNWSIWLRTCLSF